jgi:anti-sigma B factor antagonist
MRHLPGFGIEVHPARERVVLVISGELDLDTAPRLQAALDEARASGVAQIIVDLRAVTFVDSTAIALLMSEDQKPGEFSIAYRDGPVKRVLELTGLLSHFDTRPVGVDADRRDQATTEGWLRDIGQGSVTA